MTELPCAELFGEQRAAEVKMLIERVVGHVCPGAQGYRCPLVHPDDEPDSPSDDANGDLARAILAAQV